MSDGVNGRELLALKDRIVANVLEGNWRELGLLTDCEAIVENYPRLLRSLSFGDPDYDGNALGVLQQIIRRSPANFREIIDYVNLRFPDGNMTSVSSAAHAPSAPSIVFQPGVFEVPRTQPDPHLVSAMMPFDGSFRGVADAISAAAVAQGMRYQRADDIWVHSAVIQDIFSLIFRSFIVVCDFTGKNPNVFYEAGIAHTLGKHVIPITQNSDHIPFDLRHHRYLLYLNNGEGLEQLRQNLGSRIASLILQRAT